MATTERLAVPEGTVLPRSGRPGGSSGASTPAVNLVMLFVAATLVIAAFGLNLLETIVAPVFFALTLVLAGQPVQRFLTRHGWPKWLAAVGVMLMLYLLLILLVWAMAMGVAQLTELIPSYGARFQALYLDALAWLDGLGVETGEIQQILGSSFSVASLMSLVTSVWQMMSAASTQLVTILLAMFFLSFDVPALSDRLEPLARRKPDLVGALHSFSYRVRRYWIVATLFGVIVSVLDVIALEALGVPLAITWGIFAFVTNYIPNVGFVIGLIPPALLALLDEGVGTMIWVIVLFSVINFVLQSLVQPKFTGDAVGLSATVTFLSLVFWTVIVGPLGAVLAVPLTLFVQSLLIDSVPESRWLNVFLGPAREDLHKHHSDDEDLGRMMADGVRRITPRPLRPTGTRIARGAVRSREAERRRTGEGAGERPVRRRLARLPRLRRGEDTT